MSYYLNRLWHLVAGSPVGIGVIFGLAVDVALADGAVDEDALGVGVGLADGAATAPATILNLGKDGKPEPSEVYVRT